MLRGSSFYSPSSWTLEFLGLGCSDCAYIRILTRKLKLDIVVSGWFLYFNEELKNGKEREGPVLESTLFGISHSDEPHQHRTKLFHSLSLLSLREQTRKIKIKLGRSEAMVGF
jgi:hypothetical protein